MIIDTRDEAVTLWRTKSLAIGLFISFIAVVAYFAQWSSDVKMLAIGAAALVMLFLYWYQYRMEYSYFFFSNNSKNLEFKWYALRSFRSKPRTITIAKMNFYKYDIDSSFHNRKETLVLYQKTAKGIAKYPPISLSLLTPHQKTELKRALWAAAAEK